MAKSTGKKGKQTGNGRYLLWFWLAVIIAPSLVALHLLAIANGLYGPLPSLEELENPKSNQASMVLSSDGKLLGSYFAENRSSIRAHELSPHIINALISTEDERFRSHSGIDIKSILRAVAFLGKRGGGSTITQQLAKNLFDTRKDGRMVGGKLVEKPAEWILAVRLERRYTKEEILAMYLNTVDFINGAVGIKSASYVYFSTTPDSLRVEEAAMLVGMVKNPSLFNPKRRPEMVRDRRNTVFMQMRKNGHLTKAEEDSLDLLPLELNFRSVDHNTGLATYFREVLRGELREWCAKHVKPDGTTYDLYRDGLKIYTTIDSRLQQYAEEAVEEHIREHQQRFYEDQARNPKAPFRGVSDEEIEDIMLVAMRRSHRYNVRLDRRPDIRKLARDYFKYKSEESRGLTEIERLYKELDRAKRLQRDAEYQDLEKRIHALRDNVKELKPDLERTWNAYQKPWKPFDDSLKVEFAQPVEMTIFSWNGEIDTVMSPIDSIRYYKHFLQSGLLSMDPRTGFVRAWVGGINYKHFKYDNVKQGARQVGSTFKPFVYALAIQEGWSPCEKVLNIPITFDKERWGLPQDWTPKNSDDKLDGEELSLRKALANSVNYVTAFVMKKFGPQSVIDLVRKMGITAHIDPYPAICLGTPDISVYEMVAANATFANKGVYIEPIVITRIEDKNGNILEEFAPKTNEVMDEQTAYAMLSLMEGVVQSGTGVRLRYKYKINTTIAGKTGTTQNQSDGWFMGLTPDLVTGVWTGCEDRAAHFRTILHGQGAAMALPIWGLYMNKVYADSTLAISKGPFERPETPLTVELDCAKFEKMNKRKGPGLYTQPEQFE
jgi:penicillin-binding protein 1A